MKFILLSLFFSQFAQSATLNCADTASIYESGIKINFKITQNNNSANLLFNKNVVLRTVRDTGKINPKNDNCLFDVVTGGSQFQIPDDCRIFQTKEHPLLNNPRLQVADQWVVNKKVKLESKEFIIMLTPLKKKDGTWVYEKAAQVYLRNFRPNMLASISCTSEENADQALPDSLSSQL